MKKKLIKMTVIYPTVAKFCIQQQDFQVQKKFELNFIRLVSRY